MACVKKYPRLLKAIADCAALIKTTMHGHVMRSSRNLPLALSVLVNDTLVQTLHSVFSVILSLCCSELIIAALFMYIYMMFVIETLK